MMRAAHKGEGNMRSDNKLIFFVLESALMLKRCGVHQTEYLSSRALFLIVSEKVLDLVPSSHHPAALFELHVAFIALANCLVKWEASRRVS